MGEEEADHEAYSGAKAIMLNLIPICKLPTFILSVLIKDIDNPRTLANFVASDNACDAIKVTPSLGYVGAERNPNSLVKMRTRKPTRRQNNLLSYLDLGQAFPAGRSRATIGKKWLAR
jgi:hypothetical protein